MPCGAKPYNWWFLWGVRLHIGQWVNEEILSINNAGGFLFQVDLEKSNNVSESLSSNNRGRVLFLADFEKKITLPVHLDSEK